MPLPSETTYAHPEDRLHEALMLQHVPVDPDRVVDVRAEVEKAEAMIREHYSDRNDAVAESIIQRTHIEHEHVLDIRHARRDALDALTEALRAVDKLAASVEWLSTPQIMDVEVEGRRHTLASAITQATVGLAAVRGILPAVNQ